MAVINEVKLGKQLKEPVSGGFLLYGTQNYLIDLYEPMILHNFTEQFSEEVQIQYMDFENMNYDELEDHLLSVGFFSAQKVVIVRNFEPGKVLTEDKKRLFALTEQLDKDSLLILKANAADSPKTGKIATFAKGFPATAVLLEKRSKDQILKFVLAFAKREGANLGEREAQFLIDNTSEDMLFLQNEILKLAAYKNGEAITKEDIDNLTPKTVEQRAFDLIDHILKNNLDKSITQLNHLYNLGEETIPIFSAFASAFTDIYRLKTSREYNQKEEFLIENFGYRKSDFRLKKAGWYVNKLSWDKLDKIVKVLFETDKKLKFTAMDNRLALETCFVSIANIYNGRV